MKQLNKKTLVIIPARKGSKRVPKKNIRNFAGKPLIAWTIEAIKHADIEADIMVSTDCELTAQIAQQHGAEVPFLRPEALASDTSSSIDMIEHAVQELAELGRLYETLIYLQPTSPLRSSRQIEKAFRTYEQSSETLSLISVSEAHHPSAWNMALPKDLSLSGFVAQQTKSVSQRSQDLGQEYTLNGSIYIVDIATLLKSRNFYLPEGCYAFITPKWQSVDIDDEEDFFMAEAICKAVQSGDLASNQYYLQDEF